MMTTEPKYDPEALNNTPLDDISLYVAQLDAALWIFDQWAVNPADPDFADKTVENEVLGAISSLTQTARDGIKDVLGKYVANLQETGA